MPKKCVLCSKKQLPGQNGPFHRIPLDKNVRERWLKVLNLNDAKEWDRVCGSHFHPSDYWPHRENGLPLLKPRTVPLMSVYAAETSEDNQDKNGEPNVMQLNTPINSDSNLTGNIDDLPVAHGVFSRAGETSNTLTDNRSCDEEMTGETTLSEFSPRKAREEMMDRKLNIQAKKIKSLEDALRHVRIKMKKQEDRMEAMQRNLDELTHLRGLMKLMDRVRLMPLELPPASSLHTNDNITTKNNGSSNNTNNGTTKGKSSFLRRLGLGFGLLAVLGLLYVPAYHSAQGPIQGLGEIPIPSPPGGSQSMGSLAQLPDWSYNTTRDVRVYIQPESNTTIISPIGICTSSPLLIVIVCSSVANQRERQAIRDTWASKSNLENTYNSTVVVTFLLGESHNETLNEILENENVQYRDIIQEKFYDTYNNLTLKSIMMLKWATSNCPQVKFLMKTDDDMFVNIPVLVRLLQARSKSTGVLVGSLICNAKPIVDSKNKWYMPKYMYSGSIYPNYLSGTGYVMSTDVATKLYNAALDTPLLHLEDVYLTGVCAKRAKLRPTNHPGFSFAPRKPDPCVFRTVITAHKMSAVKLYQMWDKVNNSSLKCANSSPNTKQVKLSRKGRNAGYYSVRRRAANKC